MEPLLPVTIQKRHRNLIPKIVTKHTVNGDIKVSRTAASDAFRLQKQPKMTYKNATQIADMVNRYNTPVDPWQVSKVIEKQNSYQYILNENDDIIGTIRLQRKNVNEGYVSKLCVEENCRRKGHGSTLLNKIEQEAIKTGLHKMTANIKIDNESSRNLFAKNGYKEKMMYYCPRKSTILSYWSKDL